MINGTVYGHPLLEEYEVCRFFNKMLSVCSVCSIMYKHGSKIEQISILLQFIKPVLKKKYYHGMALISTSICL